MQIDRKDAKLTREYIDCCSVTQELKIETYEDQESTSANR
jgi:hypothetical protein